MRVLFAVNNEKVSEAIIRKYQSMYKEIISWKNVYYFNAIIKELQRDKTYDRIVIGEDLEAYANNNYEVMDNFLFDRLDRISDEATNSSGEDIPIIFIATDRRNKANPLIIKLFGIGIYNALIGNDRSYENVCKLIGKPRTKKEAKIYYGIDSDDVEEYSGGTSDTVPENELESIIRYFNKLGKDEDRYVKSFDEITAQYTDNQLRIIAAKLPLRVKAVLEESSDKYKQVMIGSVKGQINNIKKKEENQITSRNISSPSGRNAIGLINHQPSGIKPTKPVVIPGTVDVKNVKKVYQKTTTQSQVQPVEQVTRKLESVQPAQETIAKTTQNIAQQIPQVEPIIETEPIVEQPKRGRGRPKKVVEEPVQEIVPVQELEPVELPMVEATEETMVKPEPVVEQPKRGRGRPKKVVEEQISIQQIQPQPQSEPVNLFDMNTEEPQEEIEETPNLFDMPSEEPQILPGFEEEPEPIQNNKYVPEVAMPMLEPEPVQKLVAEPEPIKNEPAPVIQNTYNTPINNMAPKTNSLQATKNQEKVDISGLVAQNQKVVAFVGTSKNGTSFLVNNLAMLLSQRGIKTAIVDLTKNRNSYYIYNQNDDTLRSKSARCAENLKNGIIDGIEVNKNFTVFTGVPGENGDFDDCAAILPTLLRGEFSVILLDCDFETNINYFANATEIYLVQTFDILTIQPLTAFLNDLKYKGAINEIKLRVVVNKSLRLKKLTTDMIIGGISCYNDPASTYQNSLFNKATMKYAEIPFEEQTYAKYLERLADCEVTLNGYSKYFLDALAKLADMVYPLIANNTYRQQPRNYNDYNSNAQPGFRRMNDTLNKMRQNY